MENMIFIQFTNQHEFRDSNFVGWYPNITLINSEWLALINSDTALQIYKLTYFWIVLETKNGHAIQPSTIEYFKASPLIASVSHVVKHSGYLRVYRNEFVAKLKTMTSYDQLQQLAEQNRCIVGREDPFVKNQFFVTIPEETELDVEQIANLFYETGLFEYVHQTFNILTSSSMGQRVGTARVLKNEPAYVHKICFSESGAQEGIYFRYVNGVPIREDIYFGRGALLSGDIPELFKKEGLRVYISGNVVTFTASDCGFENRIPYFFIKLDSIKINK